MKFQASALYSASSPTMLGNKSTKNNCPILPSLPSKDCYISLGNNCCSSASGRLPISTRRHFWSRLALSTVVLSALFSGTMAQINGVLPETAAGTTTAIQEIKVHDTARETLSCQDSTEKFPAKNSRMRGFEFIGRKFTMTSILIKLERIEGKIDKVFSAVTPPDTLTCPDILRNFTYIFSGPGNNTSGTVSVDNPFTESNQVSIEYTCDQQQQQCKLLTELNLNNQGQFLLASLDSSRVPAGSLLDGNYAFTDNSVGILTVNGMKTTYTKFEGLIEISNFTLFTNNNTVSFIANCANTTTPPPS